MLEDAVSSYKKAGIPLETVWLDIPYLSKYADFSVDTKAFPSLSNYTEKLHKNNQYLMCILDAGLSADDPSNEYLKMALDYNTLIKSTVNPDLYDSALVQHVWPNQTVFLDWFNQNSSLVWN